MEHEVLIIQLQKYLKENRHSLSDEDVELLKRIIVALKNMEKDPSMDYAALFQKTVQVCDLVFRLFNDS